jgi:hypothetical protein
VETLITLFSCVPQLYCIDDLTRVIRNVVGAAHHDGEPVSRRIFGEILVGDCRMLLQPVFQSERLKGGSELVIDLGPCSPKFGC